MSAVRYDLIGAGYAHTRHPRFRGAAQRALGRQHGGGEQIGRVDLGSGGDAGPGHRCAAVRNFSAGAVDHGRLRGRGAHVDADDQWIAHRLPSPTAGSGGRQRTATSSP